MIWANDGWCYIPQLNIRRKFKETHTIEEDWEGVIPLPEYIEELTLTSYEQSFPRRTSIPSSHKKPRRLRAQNQ
jgi:hypothetical protein